MTAKQLLMITAPQTGQRPPAWQGRCDHSGKNVSGVAAKPATNRFVLDRRPTDREFS
ncbi:MAG: hypothetical protein KIT36_19660 [Alphaproteobacteria bacterium]|nr:hypothetical protein [Alphaproteobacteria bacterium]